MCCPFCRKPTWRGTLSEEPHDTSTHGHSSVWSHRALMILAGAAGLLVGLSLFTFNYAEGASYLSDDPGACANCHVMNDHLKDWERGPHHSVAVCNDCHAPKDLVSKYLVKGINGFNHSVSFTLGNFHDPFQITDLNVQVAENNCRRCHDGVTHSIDFGITDTSCIRCHEGVGH